MKSFVAALRTLFLPYGQPITSPQVIINEDPVRADLQALYSNKVVADFIFQRSLHDYIYQALVNPAVGKPFLAFGGEDPVSFVVSEAMRIRAGAFGASALDNASTVAFSGQIFTETTVPRGYIDANTFTGGTVAGSAGGAGSEAAVPSASWLNEPTYNFLGGQMYRIDCQFCVFPDANTDSATTVRVRKGSATTAGTQLGYFAVSVNHTDNASVGMRSFTAYVQNPSINTVSTKLSLTNQKSLGAPNVFLYGDANVPIVVNVSHLGRINDQGGLSLVAASVV